ncbi:MAG TPA: hypothetical protein VF426_03650 [Marmoricola sp.]
MTVRPLSAALWWAVGVSTLLVILICGVVGSVISMLVAVAHNSHEFHSFHVHNALFLVTVTTIGLIVVISLGSMLGVVVLRMFAEVRTWAPMWQGIAGVGLAMAVLPALASVIGGLVSVLAS